MRLSLVYKKASIWFDWTSLSCSTNYACTQITKIWLSLSSLLISTNITWCLLNSTFYQHYMNDVLFNYLHQFCQIYLDDIIIYSKILKKHKRHVQLILHKLQETDLQMNINKCKFHVQKIFFLRLLLFIEELKMNLRKV